MKSSIQEFLEYLQYEKNCSPNTLKGYTRDLREFLRYLNRGRDELEIDLQQIDHITIRDFLATLYLKGNQKSTVARKLAAVRSLFRFLHREGRIARNPARLVRTPRTSRRNPKVLSTGEVEVILELPDSQTERGARDACMLELLYATGLRASELAKLQISYLNLDIGYVRCIGKAGKI